MPVVEEDWIGLPLKTVQSLFEQNGRTDPTDAVVKYFTDQATKHGIVKIPSLNAVPLHSVRPNSLVRYRCMIQDMFDPELYLAMYETVNSKTDSRVLSCGKYVDSYNSPGQRIDFESPRNVTEDRQTFYCVPVPGEARWVKRAYNTPVSSDMETDQPGAKKELGPASKRKLAEETEGGEDERVSRVLSPLSEDSMETDSPSEFPQLAEMEDEHTADENVLKPFLKKAKESSNSTDMSSSSSSTSEPVPSSSRRADCPLPDEEGLSCLVKVYRDADSFKLNDTVEFIGILSADPSLGFQEQPRGRGSETNVVVDPSSVFDDTVAERKAHSPPPSLVPRLHCIIATKLTHANPLLRPYNLDIPITPQVFLPLSAPLAGARMEMMDLLSDLVYGDELTAEYLLMYLLSDVYARTDAMTLGKFSLNIFGFPLPENIEKKNNLQSGVAAIAKALSELVTKSHVFPMTLKNMNTTVFLPKKDYEANRLKTGMLQLSSSTNLIVDETAMTAGQLDGTGLKNLSALSGLITWQRVPYDFHYHSTDFPCNVPVLVLSEGKSLLPNDCCVKMIPVTKSGGKLVESMGSDQQNRLRFYLCLHKALQYRIPEEMQHFLEQDFVLMRKESPERMNADAFHVMLCMARVMTLSRGLCELSLQTWNHVKTLERERLARLGDK